MTVADTSAWTELVIKREVPDPAFAALIADGEVVLHPWAFGELVLGGLTTERARLLSALGFLPVAPHEEVLAFVTRHRPRRVGWVDVHLLVSALEAHATVLTLDRGLRANAALHGCAATLPLP